MCGATWLSVPEDSGKLLHTFVYFFSGGGNENKVNKICKLFGKLYIVSTYLKKNWCLIFN